MMMRKEIVIDEHVGTEGACEIQLCTYGRNLDELVENAALYHVNIEGENESEAWLSDVSGKLYDDCLNLIGLRLDSAIERSIEADRDAYINTKIQEAKDARLGK